MGAPRRLPPVDDDESPEPDPRTDPPLEEEPPEINLEQPPLPPPPPAPESPIDTHLTLHTSRSLPQSPQLPEQPQPQPPMPIPPPQPVQQPQPQLILPELQPLPEPELLQELRLQPVVISPYTPRNRRNQTRVLRQGRPSVITPPYPWATDRRAHVHTLMFLLESGITTVSGDVQCKRCEQVFEIAYNLKEKLSEVCQFVLKYNYRFHDRAPPRWMSPTLPNCDYCHQENCVKPKISAKKKSINWLFLLLGQMLGCCTLDQLKYFCKHTGNHRTGAKDRILYLAYMGLLKQVCPEGPFSR